MSKKRIREQPTIDGRLVEIYEDLANIDEKVRLKAAQSLLTEFVSQESATGSDLNKITRRLIRGLCSGRKAARLGFSVALTESLTVIHDPNRKFVTGLQKPAELVDVLNSQTNAVGSLSGQEQRDHTFGRIFGAESIIKSGILFQSNVGIEIWHQLIDIIYDVAKNKIWLREECGFILYNAVQDLRKSRSQYAQIIVDKLQATKLSKTREGLAIWIAALPEAHLIRLPSGVWHRDNPLNSKEKATVAEILRQGSVEIDDQDDGKVQHAPESVWSNQVHFAWGVVTSWLLQVKKSSVPKHSDHGKLLKFRDFWSYCVEGMYPSTASWLALIQLDSLFSDTSSNERKYWGFLLFQRVVKDVPAELLPCLLSPKFLRCFTNHLSSMDRSLHQAAYLSSQAMISRSLQDPTSRIPILKGLLAKPYGRTDFVRISKTKTVDTLLSHIQGPQYQELVALYEALIVHRTGDDVKPASSSRLVAAEQLVFMIRNLPIQCMAIDPGSSEDWLITGVLALLGKYAYRIPEILPATVNEEPEDKAAKDLRQAFSERVGSCLSHLIAKPIDPTHFALGLVDKLHDWGEGSTSGTSLFKADREILGIMNKARTRLEVYRVKTQPHEDHSQESQLFRSLTLLYCMMIIQVHNGDTEAVAILDDLNNYSQGSLKEGSATLIEILLSLVSQPSQLYHRLSQRMITSCASIIDVEGLQSMLAILQTKENAASAGELFVEDTEEDLYDGQDLDEASDVEEVDMHEAGSPPTDISSDSEEANDPEELAAFDAKLAHALGTRRSPHGLDGEQSSSSSDEDMDDEQMVALDKHLETIFRERNKPPAKKVKKAAKESIVNFKCRVLELLEIYVRQQHTDPIALNMLLPVLGLIRTTRSPPISTRACALIRQYSKICKGRKLPAVFHADRLVQMLEKVHSEAGSQGSKAHGEACSQASLLLSRALAAHDRGNLQVISDLYKKTQEKLQSDPGCKVDKSMITDFDNWFQSVEIKTTPLVA